MGSYAIIDGMLQIGDQFDHFQIEAHLAQGGMSDIYRAFDLINRREVVIKIPDQSIIGDPAQYERFQRELEVLNELNHPAILRGLGSGRYNRIPYLVTELLEGQSLRQIIDQHAPMPPDEAVAIARKVADGMAYCHENGVIHRDLKPENIIITDDGQPVIMDFGLALTRSAHRVTYSNLTTAMGTPDYMAPEQVDGQRGDQRTDVYALGTILYEMLAGKTPFTGDNSLAVMAQHMHGTAPRLDHQQKGISPQLAAVVNRSLQRDAADRYQDMLAFIEGMDHPDTADLALLEKVDQANTTSSIWQSSTIKAIGISLVILLAIIALAVILQALRP
jgi:eukaryotic-like serine/threonine-protein kinase